LADVPLDGADISSIRYCRTGAAPLSPELGARFERLYGLHVHESLGMTEMAGISTITPPGVIGPAGCVGFPLPFTQLRIVALDERGNASDRELPAGEPGMVLFKSPNLFSGFIDPADTAKAFTADGWLATGDMGWLDAEGRLNLTGRAKDLIIRSGHNIDPKVIEDALDAHPAVQLAAAVGAPDAYAGEVPVAYATLMPGASVTEDELLAFVAARVDEAPAKPRRVTVLERMPTTNVGKIFKPELRQLAAIDTAAALLRKLWRETAPAGTALPEVRADGPDRLLVRVPAGVQPLADAAADALARLGVKARLVADLDGDAAAGAA
jgi:fatty-acyl-CoA synthase